MSFFGYFLCLTDRSRLYFTVRSCNYVLLTEITCSLSSMSPCEETRNCNSQVHWEHAAVKSMWTLIGYYQIWLCVLCSVYFVGNAKQRIWYSWSIHKWGNSKRSASLAWQVTEVSCACVLLPVTSLLKGHPNETAPRVPFKFHAGVQETMLRYRCYFEWCHAVKLAALNYCRPLWCCLYPCRLVNTYNHTADSWSRTWYCQ